MSDERRAGYLSPREAAPLLGRSDDTIVSWCKRGVFQGVIMQGAGWLKKPRYLIPTAEVERVAREMGMSEGKANGLVVTA